MYAPAHRVAALIEPGLVALDLLLFAYIIRNLLEFRLDANDGWLLRAAFVYGLGITNNWAMIGFFPLFLAALIWIRGLSLPVRDEEQDASHPERIANQQSTNEHNADRERDG